MKSEKLAKITVRYRLIALDRLIKFLGADTRLSAMTRDRLNDFKRELLKTTNTGAYWMLQKLQVVFKAANYEGFMSQYPFLGFKYPKNKSEKQFLILTLDEMRGVSELFSSKQTKLAWDIARTTGIRGNDLLMLEYKDFRFDKKIIKYRNHKLRRFDGVRPDIHLQA